MKCLLKVEQDGGVEGCELTSSQKTTKFTTAKQPLGEKRKKSHWNIPEKISYIQRQRRSHNKGVGEGKS